MRNALQFAAISAGIFLGGVLADRAFEPFMAGTSLAVQTFAQLVGQGAGSGMARDVPDDGNLRLALLHGGLHRPFLRAEKAERDEKRKLNNGKVGLRSLLPQAISI